MIPTGGTILFSHNEMFKRVNWKIYFQQKLLKWEEVEAKADEEPKGEIIVGTNGKALRPQGKGTTFTQINSLSIQVYLDSSPLSGLPILEVLWLLGETSTEENDEAEEPENSTPEQARFDSA